LATSRREAVGAGVNSNTGTRWSEVISGHWYINYGRIQEYNDAVAYLLSDDENRAWPQHIQCMKEKNNAKRNYGKAMETMTLVNGVLYKKCRRTKASNEEPLRMVRLDEKQAVLRAEHDSAAVGHPDVNKLQVLLDSNIS